MMFPNKTKYRRWQTMRKSETKRNRTATRGVNIEHGTHALKAVTSARVTARQIEAARKAITRTVGKTGKYWIRIFTDRPFTAKAAEVGMGKGKGNFEGYCFEALPGRIIFEAGNVPENIAREALRKAGTKLPMKVKVVAKNDIY